jgi:hypothetical protein
MVSKKVPEKHCKLGQYRSDSINPLKHILPEQKNDSLGLRELQLCIGEFEPFVQDSASCLTEDVS